MRASSILFRLRMWIQIVIVFVGFWSPWLSIPALSAFDIGKRISTLEWLALEISRAGIVRFTYATPLVIVAGIIVAFLGALFRVWGAAYLGYFTVHHAEMQAGGVMAAGPYRYVRNPLYLGAWFMILTITLLMPPSGALFVMVLETFFLVRTILSEEAFLTTQLGDPYRAYLRAVPRIIPRFRSNLPHAAAQPNWPVALISEINPIGIFFTMAALSWRYDNLLMIKSVLVFFGLSLIVRGAMKRERSEATPRAA